MPATGHPCCNSANIPTHLRPPERAPVWFERGSYHSSPRPGPSLCLHPSQENIWTSRLLVTEAVVSWWLREGNLKVIFQCKNSLIGERAGEGLSNLLSMMHMVIQREIRSQVYAPIAPSDSEVGCPPRISPEFPKAGQVLLWPWVCPGCSIYQPGLSWPVSFSVFLRRSQPSWRGRAGSPLWSTANAQQRVWPEALGHTCGMKAGSWAGGQICQGN